MVGMGRVAGVLVMGRVIHMLGMGSMFRVHFVHGVIMCLMFGMSAVVTVLRGLLIFHRRSAVLML